MKNRLLREWAEYIAPRGFIVDNDGEVEQEPKNDYRFARCIYNNRRDILPFMIRAALQINADTHFEYASHGHEETNNIMNMLKDMNKHGLLSAFKPIPCEDCEYKIVGDLPSDATQKLFFRSGWAEQCFRYVISKVVSQFCGEHGLSFKFAQNVGIARRETPESRFDEIDLLVRIADRFYVFEVKGGPRVNIMQWAKRESNYVSDSCRVIVCTIFDEISARIFEPQTLMSIGNIEKELKGILSADLLKVDANV